MAYRIIHDWWTECSACGGNAEMTGEDRHIHGGPVPGQNNPTKHWVETSGSTLAHTNGCWAVFDEPDVHSQWYPVLEKRNEHGDGGGSHADVPA